MRNLLVGFLIGVLVATGAGVWAQSSGSTFGDPETGSFTFRDHHTGVTGFMFKHYGGSYSYSDSTGKTGGIYTYPGTGSSSYQFFGGKQPC